MINVLLNIIYSYKEKGGGVGYIERCQRFRHEAHTSKSLLALTYRHRKR